MGIGEKLLRVMEACQRSSKDGYNSFHKYKYTKAETLFAKVNEELTKAGLYVAGTNAVVVDSSVVTNANGKGEKYAVVRATIKIGDVDGQETVEFVGLGSGQDAADKAIMKANTAAFKYAYLGGLCIAMTDDPEEDTDTTAYYEPKKSQPAKSDGNGSKVVGRCEICEADVTERNMYYANKNYKGHKLCYNCQQDIKNGKTTLPADEEGNPF